MNNKLKKAQAVKVLSLFMSVATILWLAGFAMFMPQAQAASCGFTRALFLGARGSDVQCLQQYLNGAGYTVSVSGPGSPGNETTFYGGKTKAAVAKWQAAYGVPAVGRFGPLSQAKYVALGSGAPAPASVSTVYTGTGMNVALAPTNPASGVLVSNSTSNFGSQTNATVLVLRFSAGSDGAVNVTQLNLRRGGISADSDIGAVYLFDGKVRLADNTSLSSGVVNFNNPTGLFSIPAGSYKDVAVKIDLSNNVSSGKTISFTLNSAADVVSTVSQESGNFPLAGNTFSTATVTDLGKVLLATVSAPSNTDPGILQRELWTFSAQAVNQKLAVDWIRLTNVGSVSQTDLQNLTLWDGATQLGATALTLTTDNAVVFDLSANPLIVLAGTTKNLTLKGDVVSGSTRTFRMSFQKSINFRALDTQYNVYVPVRNLSTDTGFVLIQAGSAATTINSGSLTVGKNLLSASGNVPVSGTNVKLASFDFKAVGEPVQINSLVVATVTTGVGGLQNVKLFAAGSQVGSTQSFTDAATGTYNFGSSFVVPAGQITTVDVYADMKTSTGSSYAAGNTAQASLNAGSSNAQGKNSLTIISTGSASGNTLTMQTGSPSLAKSATLQDYTSATPAGVKNSQNVKIGSFTVTAGSGEGINVSQFSFQDNGTNALGSNFQNLKLINYANGAQIGTTAASLQTSTAQTYSFTPSGTINIPAGSQLVVDAYADILSNAASVSVAFVGINLTKVTASGAITSTDASLTSTVTGQNVFISSGGSLTLALAGDTPVGQQLPMSKTSIDLAKFKFTTGVAEDVLVKKVVVLQTTTGTNASGSLINYRLVDPNTGTQVGVGPIASLAGNTVTFDNSFNPFVVPKATDKFYVLRADVNGYGNASSNSTHKWSLNGVTAVGAVTSNDMGTSASTSANSNTFRVVRSKLTLKTASDSPSGLQTGNASAIVAKFTASNESPGGFSAKLTDLAVNLTNNFTGNATDSVTIYLNTANVSGNELGRSATAAQPPNVALGAWSVGSFGDANPVANSLKDTDISAGGSVTLFVVANTTGATAGKTLSVSIPGTSGVSWEDGISTAANFITTVDNMPVNANTLNY